MDFSSRSRGLIGANYDKLKGKTILIVGCGGVGGIAIEALVRSGIEKIKIVDGDLICQSNLNRQIIATSKNIGKRKIEAVEERMKEINPDLIVEKFDLFITDNVEILFKEQIDYVIDAIDYVKAKVTLINYCLDNNIGIISCLGMGNKIMVEKIEVSTLDKTFNDPLAKLLRQQLKERSKLVPVVFSTELPFKDKQGGLVDKSTPASMIFVPSCAGLFLANWVLRQLIK